MNTYRFLVIIDEFSINSKIEIEATSEFDALNKAYAKYPYALDIIEI